MADTEVPAVGEQAPHFTLPDQDGREVSLSDYLGHRLILYFYPKDNTPGCTREAQGFRDHLDEIRQLGAVVVGVSPDTPASHCRFREAHQLPFTLLSDPDGQVARLYGAWGPKRFAGREYEGVIRSTFIIGPDGRLERAMRNVKVEGHVEKVIRELRELVAAAP